MVAVMYLFLQSWRATLIPTLTVPVVLLGTFGILSLLGYSINTLTLFAMVLAIGLLVDDAIVVVENVERLMVEEDLTPLEATLRSMNEITGALIGIALVLSAVLSRWRFRRLGGDYLPAVQRDHRFGDGAFRAGRTDPDADAVRPSAQTRPS